MKMTKTIVAAAALSTAAMTANAGGLAPEVMEPMVQPVVVAEVPANGGSINSGYVVLGLLAALVAASGSF